VSPQRWVLQLHAATDTREKRERQQEATAQGEDRGTRDREIRMERTREHEEQSYSHKEPHSRASKLNSELFVRYLVQ
jgi:hypothetical protein